MVRYVHHELITAVEAACALIVTVPLVLWLRDVPKSDAELWRTGLGVAAVLAVSGLLSCTVGWPGSEKREFETALPLADPEAVLPTPQESLRRSFGLPFVGFLTAASLVVALAWESLAAFLPLLFVPARLVTGTYSAYWERRHGLLLWRGHVTGQPLGEKQYLYSSPRQPAARWPRRSASGA
ncbi:hypothetical protein JIX56_43420 [Streptomyces sp. CA-210063]|uniref:hypothetical protein n=1 Tax=Streptomyces sp. CA-210063 TaxID=2801029 RepID=UPI00214CA046|nr:hypothetical protein [Streptomyces sp. CA-210063]UUU36136.1 hypothetical protein JIX56_43420 [Streptomyces sp. CA-210063]